MNQASENSRRTLIANNQPPEILQPGIGALNNPAIAITSKMPAILMRGLGIVFPGRNDGQYSTAFNQLPGFVAVMTFIRDQIRLFFFQGIFLGGITFLTLFYWLPVNRFQLIFSSFLRLDNILDFIFIAVFAFLRILSLGNYRITSQYFKLKIHQHCGYLNPRRFQLN